MGKTFMWSDHDNIVRFRLRTRPEKIIHFKVHKLLVECLLKIPHSEQHDHPLILSGGYGKVSSLYNTVSEQNGVVMLWHAFTANEFNAISKRHIMKYIH